MLVTTPVTTGGDARIFFCHQWVSGHASVNHGKERVRGAWQVWEHKPITGSGSGANIGAEGQSPSLGGQGALKLKAFEYMGVKRR